VVDAPVMDPIRLSDAHRARAARYALLGSVLPVAVASATDFTSHGTVFFVGAAVASVVPLIVTLVSRRHIVLLHAAAFGGIPALTAMQAYSGGPASGYSVLLMMAMIWFGVQATDRELLAAIVVLAVCCYLPMLVIGPPAYPLSWGHATLLLLIGSTVAGSLRTLIREMQILTRRLRQEAAVDDLTGLLNRRGWRHTAPRELARATRTGAPTALAMIDLDNFKELNDRLGHDEGDRVLRDTAERMRATLRAGDVIARFGGDEFVALLTNSTLDGALAAIERLCEGTPPQEAISVGVAMWDRTEAVEELLRRADLALYAAKARGGGMTEIAPSPIAQLPSPSAEPERLAS
jgi:diguanylate cyclase (GGDEF)-like protein